MITMKKIWSALLTAVMVLGLICSVGIMPVSAASVNLYEWKYWNPANSNLYTQESGGKFSGRNFRFTSGTVTYDETGNNISNEPVLDVKSTYFVCNFNEKLNFTKTILNFECKVYIPKGTETNDRRVTVRMGKKDADGKYTNNTYGELVFVIHSSEGKTWATVKNTNVILAPTSLAVDADVWHQVNLRVFTNVSGHLIYGLYLDERLFAAYEASAANVSFDDVGLNQIVFDTAEKPETAAAGPSTYVKDIRLDYEDYNPMFAVNGEATILSNLLCNTVTVNSETRALSVPGYGSTGRPLVSATKSGSQYYDAENKVYQNVAYSLEKNALKVALTPSSTGTARHATIQIFYTDITEHFPVGQTKYLQMSYDICIPEGTESTERQQVWNLGNMTDTADNSKVACYNVTSSIKDGKVRFYTGEKYSGDILTEKTVPYDIKSGKWYRIIYLLKIDYTADAGYAMRTSGYVQDLETEQTKKIYQIDGNIPKYNDVGGLTLTQQRTDQITPKMTEPTEVVTYYDNIISMVSSTDFSTHYGETEDLLPADSAYAFPLDFAAADSIATVRGRKADGGGAQKMLIAAYDKDGTLIDCAVSAAAADENTNIDSARGIVEFSWDYSAHSEQTTRLKAFMFDSLGTIRPLAPAKRVELN